MCGISGLINCGSSEALQRMTDLIAHRGPDGQGVQWFRDSASGLGHRRLSIIDLSQAGRQPMANETADLWITYNGEIYNYQEIRSELTAKGYSFRSKTDTEVVLKAFEAWGENCLDKFNGMFAFAIYDVRSKTLFAARDRFGIKPFYYYEKNGCLIFGSEIKAVLASGLVEKYPDYFALHTPARFQISPYTGFEDIYKLPPAHSLIFSNGHLTIRPYWKIEASETYDGKEIQAIEKLDSLLSDAVRMQMIADVPVGVFLSGGVDSSIVSALSRRNSEQDIHSFTIKYADADRKFENATRDEIYARQVAEQFGFRYHEFEIKPDIEELLPRMVWHLDEPLSEPATINTYLMSKAARDLGIIVLLNGMGGDEIFGGYRKQLACLKADTYQSLVPGVVRKGVERLAGRVPVATTTQGFEMVRWAKRFISFASLPQTERYMMADLSLSPAQYRNYFSNGVGYTETHFYNSQVSAFAAKDLSYLTKMCLNDTHVFLPEHNLLYSDKASMAASIESRPPMTDHRIVEFMFSLPPQFRIKGATQKYLLKKVAEQYLPMNIVYRPKAPFASPLRSWIRGPLSVMVRDLLSESSVKARGIYNHSYVSELIDKNDKGVEDNAYILWTLLTNEIWFRTFFGG
jgi:asparagine synthase (glutamine-hydrolysing)